MNARITEIMESTRPIWWKGLATLATAADDDRIITTTNMKVGAYTLAAQPLYPCLLSFAATAAGATDTPGTITIVGKKHAQGDSFSEVVTPVAGSTVWTTNPFGVVTSVTGAGWEIKEGNDTIIVGVAQAATIHCGNRNATVMCHTNNLYVNTSSTAAADDTSIKLTADKIPNASINLKADTVSLLSADNATFQYIVWGA